MKHRIILAALLAALSVPAWADYTMSDQAATLRAQKLKEAQQINAEALLLLEEVRQARELPGLYLLGLDKAGELLEEARQLNEQAASLDLPKGAGVVPDTSLDRDHFPDSCPTCGGRGTVD